MAVIVADTDVLIDALRGREPNSRRIALAIELHSLSTTVINQFELLGSARNAREREKVERLLRPLLVLPLDDAASKRAAEIRLELEGEGRGIGMADYLIASICLTRSLPLFTRNREHFERVRSLVLA